MSTLPQQNTINQYVADGIAHTYNYNYLILLNTDIGVYVTASGQLPNPPADLKVLGVDYTVTNVGNNGGGTIVFTVPPPISSIVTVVRAIQQTITTNFAMASTINGANLDAAFQRCMLVSQQLQSQINTFVLQYAVDQYIPTAGQNTLPGLGSGQVWAGNGAGGITATTIVNGTDSLLRSQLASQTQAAPGAAMIGYYNSVTSAMTTVNSTLNGILSQINGGNIYLTDIQDVNGNSVLGFLHQPNAVNAIQIQNNIAGQPPVIYSAGSDTNIALNIISKGNLGVNIKGTTAGDSAPAGSVGEFLSSIIIAGSPVSLTTATPTDITHITITAGDWLSWGNFAVINTGNNISAGTGWVSATSVTQPDNSLSSGAFYPQSTAYTNAILTTVPMRRFNVTTSTPVYLSTIAAFASGTGTTYGAIYALRIR